MIDGFFEIDYLGLQNIAKGYTANLKRYAKDKVLEDWRQFHEYEVTNMNKQLAEFLEVILLGLFEYPDLYYKLVKIRIKKLPREEMSKRVEKICNARIKHDSLNSFLGASRKYGSVYMSIDVYKSIMEIVNYNGKTTTSTEKLDKMKTHLK